MCRSNKPSPCNEGDQKESLRYTGLRSWAVLGKLYENAGWVQEWRGPTFVCFPHPYEEQVCVKVNVPWILKTNGGRSTGWLHSSW
jgi:hypothetical protein